MAKCELCARDVPDPVPLPNDDAYSFDCAACGKYELTGMLRATKLRQSLQGENMTHLRGVVREETDRFGKCQTLISNTSYREVIARDDAPLGTLDQLHRFLARVAKWSTSFGATYAFLGAAEACRLHFRDNEANRLTSFLHAAVEAGYLAPGIIQLDNGTVTVRLSLEGWQLVDSLARGTQVGSQAFVAMWFHKELDPLFDEGIKPALRACGYSAYRVDRQAHPNRIDDEIIAQIRKSSLLPVLTTA